MNGQDFKNELAIKPKNVYCLVSTDSAIIDLYVHRFKQAINADALSYGEIKSFGKLLKKTILNVVYMPKMDINVFDRKEYIFIYTDKIDKRSSLYKQHQDRFIEVNNDYTNYITNNGNLSRDQAIHFAKACNNDLGTIQNNLNVYRESSMSYNRFSDNSSDLYLWIDRFIKGEKLPKLNESPISVMALLSTNCSNLLRVVNHDTKGMNPYTVKCMYDLVSYRTSLELSQIISDCFWLDCQIKKGLIDINDTVKYLILKHHKKEEIK